MNTWDNGERFESNYPKIPENEDHIEPGDILETQFLKMISVLSLNYFLGIDIFEMLL